MEFESLEVKPFELFRKSWAVVAAGTPEKFNACTVSWGSFGTLWTRPGKTGSTITVYLYPTRYTCELLRQSDTFTVGFFDAQYRKALALLGTKSGREMDKISASGLTPITANGGIAFREADMTFVCRKIYQHQLSKEDVAPDVQAYYAANLGAYPLDENGEWHPHWVFVGEILNAIGKD